MTLQKSHGFPELCTRVLFNLQSKLPKSTLFGSKQLAISSPDSTPKNLQLLAFEADVYGRSI